MEYVIAYLILGCVSYFIGLYGAKKDNDITTHAFSDYITAFVVVLFLWFPFMVHGLYKHYLG